VQAYLLDAGYRPPARHTERDQVIHNDNRIKAIWDDYRALKDWSVRARYGGQKPSEGEFKLDILPSLEAIKSHLHAFVREIG
jgi:hypothetical protein